MGGWDDLGGIVSGLIQSRDMAFKIDVSDGMGNLFFPVADEGVGAFGNWERELDVEEGGENFLELALGEFGGTKGDE